MEKDMSHHNYYFLLENQGIYLGMKYKIESLPEYCYSGST
jgi:hypothetical protein